MHESLSLNQPLAFLTDHISRAQVACPESMSLAACAQRADCTLIVPLALGLRTCPVVILSQTPQVTCQTFFISCSRTCGTRDQGRFLLGVLELGVLWALDISRNVGLKFISRTSQIFWCSSTNLDPGSSCILESPASCHGSASFRRLYESK